MRAVTLTVAGATLALALAGCSVTATPPPTAPAPSADATAPSRPATAAAAVVPFTSTVYGYSLSIPASWTFQPATTAWDGSDIDHTAEYADRLSDPEGNVYFILATPTDADLTRATDEHLAWLSSERGCPAPSTRTSTTVGGAPAQWVAIHCPDGVFGPTLVTKAITVRDGMELIATSFSPDTGIDDVHGLDGLLTSLRWSVD